MTFEVDEAANIQNIYNWYISLNLVCLDKFATSSIAISTLIGIFIGVLFVPRMGDLYGRKKVFWFSLILTIPAIAFVSVTKKVLFVDIATFFCGPGIIGRMSAGFLMLMEHMPT